MKDKGPLGWYYDKHNNEKLTKKMIDSKDKTLDSILKAAGLFEDISDGEVFKFSFVLGGAALPTPAERDKNGKPKFSYNLRKALR